MGTGLSDHVHRPHETEKGVARWSHSKDSRDDMTSCLWAKVLFVYYLFLVPGGTSHFRRTTMPRLQKAPSWTSARGTHLHRPPHRLDAGAAYAGCCDFCLPQDRSQLQASLGPRCCPASPPCASASPPPGTQGVSGGTSSVTILSSLAEAIDSILLTLQAWGLGVLCSLFCVEASVLSCICLV